MYGRVLSGLAIVLVALAVGALGLVGFLWQANDHTGSLTAASAMATFVLASVAVLTLRQNGKLVGAAIDEATATREQATASVEQATASRQTVEEMRREREWAYRPALVLTPGIRSSEVGHGFSPRWPVVAISNIGTGPAFNIRFAAHFRPMEPKDGQPGQVHQWLSAEWQGLPSGGEAEQALVRPPLDEKEDGPRNDRYRAIVDDVQVMDDKPVYAVRYDDWFGNHYRVIGPAIRPAEEYRGHPSETGAPDWARVT